MASGVVSLAVAAAPCHYGTSMGERPAAGVVAARGVASVRRHRAAFVGDAPVGSARLRRAAFRRAAFRRAAFRRAAFLLSRAAFCPSEGFGLSPMAPAADSRGARLR